ncbi:MAG: hypothetical protein JJW00_07890 [Sulfurimonas sp.]|nr:hypothetical protein [Sulfurimonas sp.]
MIVKIAVLTIKELKLSVEELADKRNFSIGELKISKQRWFIKRDLKI